MEVILCSEMSVHIRTTRGYIPEVGNMHRSIEKFTKSVTPRSDNSDLQTHIIASALQLHNLPICEIPGTKYRPQKTDIVTEILVVFPVIRNLR
jgi:hypothetical protein